MAKKILIIEDEPGILLSLKDEFEMLGYVVDEAEDGGACVGQGEGRLLDGLHCPVAHRELHVVHLEHGVRELGGAFAGAGQGLAVEAEAVRSMRTEL